MNLPTITPPSATLPWERQLTEADFLDPQLGDQFMQGYQHANDVEKAMDILRYVHQSNSHTLITTDVKIIWGRRGLLNPAPDIAVIPNVIEPQRPWTSFHVMEEETRPIFILEVVSPDYRRPDLVDKVFIYAQAGVAEYFIIDSHLQPDGTMNYEIVAYRLIRGEYRQVEPDEQSRYYSHTNNVWFAVTPDRQGFLVIDGDTDQVILPDRDRVRVAEEQALYARRETKIARQEADVARQEVEKAIKLAETEAAARLQAEQKLAEALAELARLRGETEA